MMFNGRVTVRLVGHPIELVVVDLDDKNRPRIERQKRIGNSDHEMAIWAAGELERERPGRPIIVSCGTQVRSVGYIISAEHLKLLPRLIMVADHPSPGHDTGMYCFDNRGQMGTNHLGRPTYRYDAKRDTYRRA